MAATVAAIRQSSHRRNRRNRWRLARRVEHESTPALAATISVAGELERRDH
jgi:hypothetical protein